MECLAIEASSVLARWVLIWIGQDFGAPLPETITTDQAADRYTRQDGVSCFEFTTEVTHESQIPRLPQAAFF